MVTEEVLGIAMPVYRHVPPTLRHVFESTRAFGDRPFLVYNDERTSFAEHFRTVNGLAHRMMDEYGIAKGDRVAIGMRNYPEWFTVFWATQVIGAIAVTLNAWWTGAELHYALEDSGTKLLVVDGERFERVAAHLPELPVKRVVVVRPTTALPTGVDEFGAVVATLDGDRALPNATLHPDDYSTIMYTSGTTGKPKGAVGTHRNHCTALKTSWMGPAVLAVMAGAPPDAPVPAPAEVPQAACGLVTFPFFHIGGLVGVCRHTAAGNKVVLMYRWDAAEAVDLIDREQVTGMTGVPTVVRQLLETAAEAGRDLPSLLGIGSGGAPVPPDLVLRIGSQFAEKVVPTNGYGLTETTATVVSNAGPMYLSHPDSVGRPVPVAEVRIVGEDGVDMPQGSVGELWVKGPNVVAGYWNKPEATAEAFTDGWFHTGDAAYVDDEGFVYVVDRLKDMVIRGGENVYCAEVEAALFEHPAVADVAVIGLPHPSLGEEVVAVIQQRDGLVPDAEELQAHVGERLARFKVPSRFFVRKAALPRNATGKVLKRQLRDEFTGAVAEPTS